MKKNYISGIIGALLFGIISTLPWILFYVYGNILLSILGALVGLGAYFGYKLFGGKKGKRTTLIIGIISILSITFATFVIIPFWLIAKNGQGFSMFFFKFLYSNGDFVSAIIRDYIISIIFTLLGISGVISKINKEVYEEKKEELNNENSEKLTDIVDIYYEPFEVQVKYLENLYGKYDAFSKEKAVSEKLIISEIKSLHKLKFMMNMEKAGIVVAPFMKSYFDKEAVNNKQIAEKNKRKNLLPGIIIGIFAGLFITLIIIFSAVFFTDDTSSDYKPTNAKPEAVVKKDYEYGNVMIKLPENYIKYDDKKESNYVEYLSSTEIITNVMIQEMDYNIDEQLFIENYKKELSVNFSINSVEDSVVSSFNSKVLNISGLQNSKNIAKIYIVFNNGKLEIIMFSAVTNDKNKFEEKCSEYIQNVTIKNN